MYRILLNSICTSLLLAFYEDALNLFLGLLQQFKPLHSLVGSLQKVDVGDGFQQVVQRIDFVAVYGILGRRRW